MTKEELLNEAEEWLNKWELCNKCDHKAECIEEYSYCNLVVYRAYLAGAEPREKRIAELEKACEETQELLDKQIEATYKLDKENAELDCQKNRNKFCYSCVNATEKCFKNEIGCPCDKYKSYKEENAELKSRDCWKSCEYANPKTELIGQHIKDVQNLTKAKELLERLLITSCNSDVLNLLPNCSEVLRVRVEAEQFLKYSEVEK